MAARINASNDKKFRDALLIAVNRYGKDADGKNVKYLSMITDSVAKAAANGSAEHQKIVRDCLDGRPAQAVTIGGDPQGSPLRIKWED